jgi:hypothetical protein
MLEQQRKDARWLLAFLNWGQGPPRPLIPPYKLAAYRRRLTEPPKLDSEYPWPTVRRGNEVWRVHDGQAARLVAVAAPRLSVEQLATELALFLKKWGIPWWSDDLRYADTNVAETITYADHQQTTPFALSDFGERPLPTTIAAVVEGLVEHRESLRDAAHYLLLSQTNARNRRRVDAFPNSSCIMYPREYFEWVRNVSNPLLRPLHAGTGAAWSHSGQLPQAAIAAWLNFETHTAFEAWREHLGICAYCGRFFWRRRPDQEFCPTRWRARRSPCAALFSDEPAHVDAAARRRQRRKLWVPLTYAEIDQLTHLSPKEREIAKRRVREHLNDPTVKRRSQLFTRCFVPPK